MRMSQLWDTDIAYNYGVCFETLRMDEGPVLTQVGNLALFLHILGLRSARNLLEKSTMRTMKDFRAKYRLKKEPPTL